MTSFIEEQEKLIPATENGPVKDWDRIYVQRTIYYCRFLRQPLTLGMFVPVDENGELLNPPIERLQYGGGYSMRENEVEAYEKAKEKVLFEGFSIRKERNKKYVGTTGYEIELPLNIMTIEDLANDWNVELTPSALKQIGL